MPGGTDGVEALASLLQLPRNEIEMTAGRLGLEQPPPLQLVSV
jgi:hypothetical protein